MLGSATLQAACEFNLSAWLYLLDWLLLLRNQPVGHSSVLCCNQISAAFIDKCSSARMRSWAWELAWKRMPGHSGGSHAEVLRWPLEEMQSRLLHSGDMSAKGKGSFIDNRCLFLHPLPTMEENVWPPSLGKSKPWVCCRSLYTLNACGGYLQVGLGVPLESPCCRGIPLERQECRPRVTHGQQWIMSGFIFVFLFFFTVKRSPARSGRSFKQSLLWTYIFSHFHT